MVKDVNFESVKNNGYTNYLQYRGPQKRSGISYDYMDKLNEFIDQGIFYDVNGDGFTNAEKKALEAELFKIHKEHGYKTNFTTMLPGTKTEYNYSDFIRLAKAAGYELKQKPEEKAEVKPEEKAEVKQEEKAEVKQEEKAEVKPGETKPSTTGNNSEENVIVEFESTTITDSEGKVIDKTFKSKVTPLLGSLAKGITADTIQNTKIAIEPQATEAKQPTTQEVTDVKTKEEKQEVKYNNAEDKLKNDIKNKYQELTGNDLLNAIREERLALTNEKRKLAETRETYKTKGFLGMFKKTKTRDLTAEELNQRQARINEINQQIDETHKYETYVSNVENATFWGGKYAAQDLKDASGNIIKSYPSYYRETVTDSNGNEKKAAKVPTYNKEKLQEEHKYYSLDVQKVGQPDFGTGVYYSVVPDVTNELTNVKKK